MSFLKLSVKIKLIRHKAANGCCIAAASTSKSDHQHHFGTLIAERPFLSNLLDAATSQRPKLFSPSHRTVGEQNGRPE